jgi:hypothetical protein
MLWCFGDSNTEGYNESFDWVRDYTEWKGCKPSFWTSMLADRLNTPLLNRGIGGADNYTIFDSIIKEIDNIKPDDIIVIGWSTAVRGRAVLNDKFVSLHIGGSLNIPDLSNLSVMELLNNRSSSLYMDEVMGWTRLLKHAFRDNKIIFWSAFPEYVDRDILDPSYWANKPYSINDETESALTDGHPSESGCLLLSDLFYDNLTVKLI